MLPTFKAPLIATTPLPLKLTQALAAPGTLSELLPPEVRLVDPAEAAVQRLGPLLASLGDVPEGERSSEPVLAPLQRTRLCVTGCADAFARSAAAWLDSCPSVERVALT